jgi:hypothetical protein
MVSSTMGQLRVQDERSNSTWKLLLARLQGSGMKADECLVYQCLAILSHFLIEEQQF